MHLTSVANFPEENSFKIHSEQQQGRQSRRTCYVNHMPDGDLDESDIPIEFENTRTHCHIFYITLVGCCSALPCQFITHLDRILGPHFKVRSASAIRMKRLDFVNIFILKYHSIEMELKAKLISMLNRLICKTKSLHISKILL